MRLSIGPILTYWTRAQVFEFYRALESAPVDCVYLGEVVCSRRHEVDAEDWLAIADALAAAGKEVVLSTPVLVEGEGDLKIVRRVAANARFRVEANDLSAVRLLSGRGGWVAGPHLNIYNPETLELFASLGATRWALPVEASAALLQGFTAAAAPAVEIEVFGLGRTPLAMSARCFTARHFNLQKESCGFRCIDFPEGLPLQTRDGEAFLTLNGVQTQSARVYSLAADMAALSDAGVRIFRISPMARDTVRVAALLREAINGAMSAAEVDDALQPLLPAERCNGFWHGRPGMVAERARAQ